MHARSHICTSSVTPPTTSPHMFLARPSPAFHSYFLACLHNLGRLGLFVVLFVLTPIREIRTPDVSITRLRPSSVVMYNTECKAECTEFLHACLDCRTGEGALQVVIVEV